MRRTTRLLAPPLLAALLLAGCTPSDPMPTPPPTSDAAPIFATDEEALAAAEEAYGKYLATADNILSDGGADPERLLEHVSPSLYDEERVGFERIMAKGWRGVGKTTFQLTLQRYDERQVIAYSCDDVSATDLVDQSGTSVVKEGRIERVPFEVEFDPRDGMRILSKAVWDGGGVC